MNKKTTKISQIKPDSIWKNKYTDTFAKVRETSASDNDEFATVAVYIRVGTPGRYRITPVVYTARRFVKIFDLQTPVA